MRAWGIVAQRCTSAGRLQFLIDERELIGGGLTTRDNQTHICKVYTHHLESIFVLLATLLQFTSTPRSQCIYLPTHVMHCGTVCEQYILCLNAACTLFLFCPQNAHNSIRRVWFMTAYKCTCNVYADKYFAVTYQDIHLLV